MNVRSSFMRIVLMVALVGTALLCMNALPVLAEGTEDGIAFTSKEKWQLEEELDGWFRTGWYDDAEYFYYIYDFNVGDQLTITKDGVTTVYTYSLRLPIPKMGFAP